MKNIVILGAPGSGKGTQSELLIQKYGFKHISTGDVLRAEIAAGTELGKTAQGFIDHGQLIPDSLMIEILAHKYDELCPCEGLIFDGFPRTIAQAEALDKITKIDLFLPNSTLKTSPKIHYYLLKKTKKHPILGVFLF